MATVNKDFRIKSGLIVEGANATVNGENIITTGSSTDNLQEGTTNLYFTNQRALDAVGGDVSSSIATAINALSTSDIEEGSNLYFTDQRALTATASAYDVAGSATTAENNAKSYADGLAVNYDAAGAASAAQTAAQGYTDTAISSLVNGAPALLDTLNELAAAINDDASFASTIATQIGGKQNTLTAGTNISIVSDTISVTGLSSTDISDFSTAALSATASAYDVAGAASSAETAANGYTDTAISGLSSVYEPIGAAATAVGALTTDDIEEGSNNLYFTDARAVDAITTETIYPPAVVINNLSKQVAATQTVEMISTVNGLTWAKSEYKSAKLTVKAKTASHTQLSEILVTLDGSDNVAITEYGIVYTDTELAVVSADVSGTDVRIRVTTVNPSTGITVVGMLIV